MKGDEKIRTLNKSKYFGGKDTNFTPHYVKIVLIFTIVSVKMLI